MSKIADISKWQGAIDWAKASKELGLVIIRVQDGESYADPLFDKNAAACEKYGVPYGVYGFFRAKTEAGAKTEAAKMISRVGTHKPLFWVADVEKRTTAENSAMGPVVTAWRRAMGTRKTGLYISQALYPSVSKASWDFVWIPRYGLNDGVVRDKYKPKYPCDLWQYTSKGRISGISESVDLNTLNGSRTLEWFTGSGTQAANALTPPVPWSGRVVKNTWYARTHYDARVYRWQKRMRERGWTITTDGLYGPQSAGVAYDFQKEKHLTVDGILGPETYTAAWTEPVT